MPYSRVHRLFRIVTMIQSRTGWTAARLAEECGVDERTIYRDFKELEGVGVPLYFDNATAGYRVRSDFFLPPVQLTPEEALALSLLCEQIGEKQQIAFLRPAWRALSKIRGVLPPSIREELTRAAESVAIQTTQTNPGDGYSDVYERIREAISSRRALECRYDSGGTGGEGPPFVLHPYALLFSVRAWYVVGFHAGRSAVRSLKLSRFAKVSVTEQPFDLPEDFTIEAHLGNAWRLVRGERDYEVEIVFDADFAPTMSDTAWHRTQSIEEHDDGSATFRCVVSGLDEIVWWVLGMGPHCRVINPPELATRVRELASQTAALYATGSGEPGPK
jgi:predicted DNA-binding transcriptional regulator YafY